MQDAVDVIGKIISIEDINYTIVKVYFVPGAVNDYHNLYFGLTKENETTTVNCPYYVLLPYIKKSIKL
jgi:hypothetical protein